MPAPRKGDAGCSNADGCNESASGGRGSAVGAAPSRGDVFIAFSPDIGTRAATAGLVVLEPVICWLVLSARADAPGATTGAAVGAGATAGVGMAEKARATTGVLASVADAMTVAGAMTAAGATAAAGATSEVGTATEGRGAKAAAARGAPTSRGLPFFGLSPAD